MQSNTIKLEGTVDSVRFQSSTNGYVVLDLDTDGDLVTVVGELGEVKEGERLIVDGEYTTHARFGTQFKAHYCDRKLPETRESIERYLGSGVVEGIGAATAKRIVDAFGEDTFRVMEDEPERLASIKGISKKKALKVSKQLRHIFNLRELVQYLLRYGIGSSYAMRAFRRWDYQAIEKVKDDPYVLCQEGIDLPFNSAEALAAELGVRHDSYKRLSAGLKYVLSNASLDGHTCLPYGEFVVQARRTLSVGDGTVQDALSRAVEDGTVYVHEDAHGVRYVYSMQYYRAERYVAKKVATMVSLEDSDLDVDFTELIDACEERFRIEYGARQREAINLALNSNFTVLTGGPGTGKTTTLKAIMEVCRTCGLKMAVTAPTGRAAKRVSEVTGQEAMTIHRLLEVSFDSEGRQTFQHDERNPLTCKVLIVDETSMVDVLLFESLLRANSVSCKVVLVGDSDQLPSVGAGNLLTDLIASGVPSVVTLDEVFRQAQQSAIVMNAHRILRGERPDLRQKDSDFFFLQRLDVTQAQETIIDLWQHRLPKAYGYDPIDDIQVLSPSRKGALGTLNLNVLMQRAINPHVDGRPELKNANYTFRVHDKVMQTRNNYDATWSRDGVGGSGIYNGDIGIIEDISRDTVSIDFDGRRVTYDRELVDQLELAYATTVHKSQGSEFDVVIVPTLGTYSTLCYRNLLYTGITRAKKLLVLVGSANELYRMVDNDRQDLRYSRLRDMLLEASDGVG